MSSTREHQPEFDSTRSQQVLDRIHNLLDRLQGSRSLCARPIERFDALRVVLAGLDASHRQPVQADFAEAVADYRLTIAWQAHYPRMLCWIATSHRLVEQVYRAHSRISAIYGNLGLDEDPELSSA